MPLRPAQITPPTLSRRGALRTFAGAAITAAAGARTSRVSARSTATRTYQERINFGARALHLDPRKSTPDYVLSLVDLVDKTELNALVIDIKEDGVYYSSDVELFRANGVVVPLYDIADLIGLMHDHGIYTIARLVSFKDPILAERRPDLAVGDIGGGIWRDVNGVPWLNPFNEEVWAANAALAAEAALLGFDEIQLDYVRFPTDGNLSRMVFGQPLTQESRQHAVLGYIQLVQETVRPHGAALGADIFGWTLVVDDDNGIGQNAVQIAPEVDFFCPMVYPSHWPYGSLNLPGHPNDFPYQTIEISMELATAKLPTQVKKVRPWLQAFSLPGMKTYTSNDIRAQIDAAQDTGIEGWMLWNFGNPYPADAFRPG
jgi:hypothetical protein